MEDGGEGIAGAAADNGVSAALAEDAVGGAEDDGEGSVEVAADVEDSAGRVEQAGRSADNGGSAADCPAHRAADQEGSAGGGVGRAVEGGGGGLPSGQQLGGERGLRLSCLM